MSSHFVRIGLARVGLVSSLCLISTAGCSSDASLGGQHNEQDADERDAGDGGSSFGGDQLASTGSYSTASTNSGSVQTASASNVNGTVGSVTSVGGADGTAVGGSDNVSVGGSATGGNTTGATGGGTGGSGGSGETASTVGAYCEMYQCARPIECVESCGGPILKSSCCPCEPGTFDQFQCPIADCASSADCGSDEYCYFEGETCGEDGSLGTCRGRILLCPAVIIPTCGCDLVIYDSECAAAYAGVSVTAFDRCSED